MTSSPPPRSLLFFLLFLVATTLLLGSLHAFAPAQASVPGTAVTPISSPAHPSTTPTGDALQRTVTPESEPSPTPPAGPHEDTSGIAAMAGVILLVILLGAAVGLRKPASPKARSKSSR